MSRKHALALARVCGYHNDSTTFTRLRIEARVRYELLLEQWHNGASAKAGGVKCTCLECQKTDES